MLAPDVPTKPYVAEIGTYGGTLRQATIADPKKFNPITAAETSSTAVTQWVFEGLTTSDPVTGLAKPHLADSWDVTDDGTTWTFHLRTDVHWSDGEPFTSADVLFTLDAVMDPRVTNSLKPILTIDGEPVRATAPDAHTVVFHLPTPYAPFDRAAGFSILPKHKLQAVLDAGEFESAWGVDTPPREVVGTGPFLFTEYVPGQRFVLARNPKYWKRDAEGNRLPYLDRIVYEIVQNTDVVLLKFQQGETDTYGVRGKDYPLLKPKEGPKTFKLYRLGPQLGSSFVFFNLNGRRDPDTGDPYVEPYKLAWFSDVRFRRAVAHAIDKQGIIDIVLNGLGYPQSGPMNRSAGFFYNPNVKKYPYDLDRSRELLADMGIEDRDGDGVLEDATGRKIEFNFFTNSGNQERVDIAEIIRKDLQRLGMIVHFNQVEFNVLTDKLDNTYGFDMVLLALTGGDEPHFGKNVWDSKGHLHMWNPQEPEPATPWEARIDEIFNQAVQELDRDKRKTLYDEWQVIVSEQLPLIYTVAPESIIGVRATLGNIYPTVLGRALHNIEEIYVKPE